MKVLDPYAISAKRLLSHLRADTMSENKPADRKASLKRYYLPDLKTARFPRERAFVLTPRISGCALGLRSGINAGDDIFQKLRNLG